MTRAASRIVLALVVWLAVAGVLAAAPPVPGKRGRTTPPAHSRSQDNAMHVMARLQAGKMGTAGVDAALDTLRLVALRVAFPDLAFGDSPPPDTLRGQFYAHDRFYYEVQFSYLRQYFAAASAGRLDVRVDVPEGVAVAAEPQSVYGNYDLYDSLMVRLTGEAVAFFDDTVDFSAYDGFILLHAGPGQESDVAGDSPTQIWSGFVDRLRFRAVLSTPDSVIDGIPTRDGVVVSEAIVLPEWEVQDLQVTGGTRTGHLGVYAHETGQKLGMLPLFDADPAPIPNSQGVGNFCLMGYGLWVANGAIPSLPCAFNRLLMGWVEPLDVPGDGECVLRDQETGPADSVVVRVPISAREYFLVSYVREDRDGPVECGGDAYRRFFHFDDKNENCRFDFVDTDGDGALSPGDSIDTYAGAEWDFFMTDLIGSDTAGDGYGLLVLHVDELALQEALLAGSTNVESDPRRKGVDVEEADGIEDLDRFPDNPRAFGSADDYFKRGRSFASQTVPATVTASGSPTGIEIALVALPDSTASALEPSFGLPGPRARVRVRRDLFARPDVAPRAGARRQLAGTNGADLVALPLAGGGAALVVPGAAGDLYLLDATLDDLPARDGDPATLAPWAILPEAVRGAWAGAPAVGDLDGDLEPEVVLLAADSLPAPATRVFAWHRDGSGAGSDVRMPALVATVNGTPRTLALFDLDARPGDEITVATESAAGVHVWTSAVAPCPQTAAGAPRRVAPADAEVLSAGVRLGGGPVGVCWSAPACAVARGVAWVEADTLAARALLRFAAPGCCDTATTRFVALPTPVAAPYAMVSGDLDGDGTDEIVLADAAGRVLRATVSGPGAIRVDTAAALDDSLQSPLAVADLDGDGARELVIAGRRAMHVLSFSGAERPGWPSVFADDPALATTPAPARGAGTPLVVDVDGDARREIVLHLPGGALVVWDRDGERRRDLEAALPASESVSPLVADLDADGRPELAALARFAQLRDWDAAGAELTTQMTTDCGLWRWPRIAAVVWGEVGGGSGHAFAAGAADALVARPNDAALPSFVVAPNPAASTLRARVELTSPAQVSCSLYNLEGERVRHSSRAGATGEIVEFQFDVSGIAAGIYLARMEVSGAGSRVRPVAIRR